MLTLELTEKMEIHYTTKRIDYSFTHEFGLEKRFQDEIDKWDLVVRIPSRRWVFITDTLPESLYLECEKILEKHVYGKAFE